jgi:hypothetical protein
VEWIVVFTADAERLVQIDPRRVGLPEEAIHVPERIGTDRDLIGIAGLAEQLHGANISRFRSLQVSPFHLLVGKVEHRVAFAGGIVRKLSQHTLALEQRHRIVKVTLVAKDEALEVEGAQQVRGVARRLAQTDGAVELAARDVLVSKRDLDAATLERQPSKARRITACFSVTDERRQQDTHGVVARGVEE